MKEILRSKVIVFALSGCVLLFCVKMSIAAVACFTECQGANWITDCQSQPGQDCVGEECYREVLPAGYYIGQCCAGGDYERGCKMLNFYLVYTSSAFGGPCYVRPTTGVIDCGNSHNYCNCQLPWDAFWFDDYGHFDMCFEESCLSGG